MSFEYVNELSSRNEIQGLVVGTHYEQYRYCEMTRTDLASRQIHIVPVGICLP